MFGDDNNYNANGTYEASVTALNEFMVKVFGWLFLGLIATAVTSFLFIGSLVNESSLAFRLFANPIFFFGIIIAELGIVVYLSRAINKISAGTAKMMYAVYAVLNGVTLSYIILAYAGADVTQAFIMAALFFGVMCMYGYFTKSDMTSLGRVLMVGLIVLIAAMVINMFIGSATMDFVVCVAGLMLFVGLTAYDVQKIKIQYYTYVAGSGEEAAARTAIYGALKLYLDFINMFLFILRLLGIKSK